MKPLVTKTLALTLRAALLSLLISLCANSVAMAQSNGSTLSVERLQNVRLLPAKGDAKAMVVYFSDRTGWNTQDDTIATALSEDGNVVLGVDLAAYAKELDKADGVCLYVVGEITDLAQTAQRQLNIQTYLPPIVAGTGEGATFAYAALADAPANTLGGAVASGFANRLTLRLPFCPGSTASKTADGKAYSYAFDKTMPEAATVLVGKDTLEATRTQAAQQANITVEALDSDNITTQIVTAISALVDENQPFGTLPAVDLPTTTPPKALAIFISGDGGWRDIDKTMGEWLSTQGVHVVGLDALRYFWSKRTPQELATDIATLIKGADPQGKLPVMLIGYSFGVDTIPFAYPLLPKDLQDRTRVLALMAPSVSTSMQVTISGWLGIDDSGYPVPPAIAALPKDKVLCVYGKDDDEGGCEDPAVKDIPKIETDGGHHFDGEYIDIARRFLDKL